MGEAVHNKRASVDVEFGALKCPVCGDMYLHLEGGTFGMPSPEDGAGAVSYTTVRTSGHVSTTLEPALFDFRPGVELVFWCEHECIVPRLSIKNRKGFTLLEWSYE